LFDALTHGVSEKPGLPVYVCEVQIGVGIAGGTVDLPGEAIRRPDWYRVFCLLWLLSVRA
jgi:hypothetical protein